MIVLVLVGVAFFGMGCGVLLAEMVHNKESEDDS